MDTIPKRRSPARPADSERFEERIRQRAYDLHLERSQDDGHELEDWLMAEEEITEENVPIA